MLLVVSSILLKSLRAISGAASIAHRLIWVRYWPAVMPPLPISSMYGSFQWPGPANFLQPRLRETNQRHAAIAIANIVGCAPHVPPHLRIPLPDGIDTVLTKAVNDGPTCIQARLVHLPVCRLHPHQGFLRILAGIVQLHDLHVNCKVVFQKVQTPAGVGIRILLSWPYLPS